MLTQWLARKWTVNDPLPTNCDLIVPVAHGSTNARLTHGAQSVVNMVRTLMFHYRQHPWIAYGAFKGSSDPRIEGSLKERAFPYQKSYIGSVMSTIEECRRVKADLQDSHGKLKTIIVVTDEAHSRRCRIVWKTFFPNSDIRIVSVELSSTIDVESPMTPYHRMWKALFFQSFPTPIYWLFSLGGTKTLELLEGAHQPTARK